MTWNTIRPWLGTLARLVLGVVWIWSALSKLGSPREFVQAVRAYDATPEWMSKAIGYGLPVLEFSLGVLLILGITVRLSAAISGLLFLVFLIGIIEVSARGIKLDCGCFGGGGQTAGGTTYLLDSFRDIGLLVLAVYLVLWPITRLSIDEFLARNDYVEPPSAKRMRSEQGYRKYTALVESRRKEARERSLYVNSALSIVVVLVAIVGIGVQAGRAKIQGDLSASNATIKEGVVYGLEAPATVDVYEDFQCPNCKTFEDSVGTWLNDQVKANRAQVRYHVLAFLDSGSNGNRYSTRAANAAICASDVDVSMFVAYHKVLFANQPAEGTNGRTNNELITYAQQAGMTAAQVTTFTTCVQTEQHKAFVEATTEQASKRGVTGTPTVYVNGSKLKDNALQTVQAAIAKAVANSTRTPSPSPSGSASRSVSPSASPSASPAVSPSASPSKTTQ